MAEDQPGPPNTIGLNTKVEDDFVSPLTMIRGSLEILRDFKDLSDTERQRFLERALSGCARLEKSIDELSDVVYAAGQRANNEPIVVIDDNADDNFMRRIHVNKKTQMIEIDFSDYEFSSSATVNEFYDVIDRVILDAGGKWYFAMNQRDCRVWPEAWIAFAHRSKKVRVTHSLGTVRYAEYDVSDDPAEHNMQSDLDDPDFFSTRQAALNHIEMLKA